MGSAPILAFPRKRGKGLNRYISLRPLPRSPGEGQGGGKTSAIPRFAASLTVAV
jgi:hypothetical protein